MMIFPAIALKIIVLIAQVPIQESSFEMLKKQLEQENFKLFWIYRPREEPTVY
jgi:hypothetical protein